MIRTGNDYRDLIRDDCQVWINGERAAGYAWHGLTFELFAKSMRVSRIG